MRKSGSEVLSCRVPQEIAEAVDAAVKSSRYRFRNRSAFVRMAVMRLLRRLERDRLEEERGG